MAQPAHIQEGGKKGGKGGLLCCKSVARACYWACHAAEQGVPAQAALKLEHLGQQSCAALRRASGRLTLHRGAGEPQRGWGAAVLVQQSLYA